MEVTNAEQLQLNGISLGPDPKTAFQPVTDTKRRLLTYAATVEEFLKTCKFGDWNTFSIMPPESRSR